jgi:hypothetical protein
MAEEPAPLCNVDAKEVGSAAKPGVRAASADENEKERAERVCARSPVVVITETASTALSRVACDVMTSRLRSALVTRTSHDDNVVREI